MSLPIYVVDSFTDRPFSGNPAGVCLLDREYTQDWMQRFAAELNLSETAYLLPTGEHWKLRWFTPKTEVDLCGHATLASAHILREMQRLGPERAAVFETRSGRLTCTARDQWIEMDFPSEPPVATQGPPGLLQALNVSGTVVGQKRNRLDFLVEVPDVPTLRALRPNMRLLAQLPVRGVIVTARSDDPRFDFMSRFFAPSVGIDEDPVTGSAHCCLAPYWAQKLGKHQMVGFQVSARGGIVRVAVDGDRVLLSGQAVTILRAEFVK